MTRLAQSSGGRVAVVATDRLLDTAHGLLDTYLPPGKGDLHDSDGRDGSIGVKAVALACKTRRRFKRTVYTHLNVNHSHLLDDDDIIITVGHLVELGRRSLCSWYVYVTHQPYVSGTIKGAGVVGTLVVDGTGKVQTALMGGVKVVQAQVVHGVGRVQAVATKSSAGSMLQSGVHQASDVVMGGVGMAIQVTTSGMTLAHEVLAKGVSLVHITVMGGFDVAHQVMLGGADVTQGLVRHAVGTTHTMVRFGARVTHTVVTSAVGVAHGIMSGSLSTTKYVANYIPRTITSFILIGSSPILTTTGSSPILTTTTGSSRILTTTTGSSPILTTTGSTPIHATTAQANTQNVLKTTKTVPKYAQDTTDGLAVPRTTSVTSLTIPDAASNPQMYEEVVYSDCNADDSNDSDD